jgi:hypothetical protein
MADSNGRHGAGESDEERDSDEDEEEYNSDVYFERLDAERNQKKIHGRDQVVSITGGIWSHRFTTQGCASKIIRGSRENGDAAI